jgi:hypothetical protein
MGLNVYVVKAEGRPDRLIEAATITQAVAYAARTTFSAAKASQQDLIRLLPGGTPVERLKDPQGDLMDDIDVKVDTAGNVVQIAA